MKTLVKIFIGLALLLVIAAGVSYFMLQRYLSSPDFSDDISRMASEKLKGDLVLTDFTIKGLDVTAKEIELKDSGKIESIKINGFNTNFAQWAVFDRTWKMRSLECDDLRVHILRKKKKAVKATRLKPERPSKAANAAVANAPKPPKSAPVSKPKEERSAKKSVPAFYKRFIPTELEFGQLKVKKFSGLVERKKEPVSWNDVEMNGDFKGDMLKLDLTGGTLNVPFKALPIWNINKATVIATEETYEVKDGSFNLPGGGSAILNGSGAISGGDLSLVMDLKSVPLASILKKQSKSAMLAGMVDGNVKVVTEDRETVTKGKMVLNEGTLTLPSIAKPILKFIKLDDGNELKLDQCSSDVTHINDKTVLENLHLTVGNAYSLTGKVVLDNDRYTLRCQLGLSPEVHSRLPRGLQAQYTQRGSFYWIPVNESGNKDDIAKDLGAKALASLSSSFLGGTKILDAVEKHLGKDISDLLEEEAGEKLKEKGLDALMKLFR